MEQSEKWWKSILSHRTRWSRYSGILKGVKYELFFFFKILVKTSISRSLKWKSTIDTGAIRFLVEQFQLEEESIRHRGQHFSGKMQILQFIRTCFITVVWCFILCVYNVHFWKCVLGQLNVQCSCIRDIKHCSMCTTASQFHIFDIDNGWNVQIFQIGYRNTDLRKFI